MSAINFLDIKKVEYKIPSLKKHKIKEQNITLVNVKNNKQNIYTEQYIYTREFSLKCTFLVENGYVKFLKSQEI